MFHPHQSLFVGIAIMASLAGQSSPILADPPATSRITGLSNDEAWKFLRPENPPLPAWARVLAQSLPKTTASMLELDYVHRTKNPLGPVLYGKLRWVAADAIGCAYSKRYAEADLKQAGLSEVDLQRLAKNGTDLPRAERAALEFARKMSRAAHTVTDAEVAALVAHYGPDKLVAIVHTLAHANFQDRIFLALGVEVETGGPLPPLDLRLDADAKSKGIAAPRPPWKGIEGVKVVVPDDRPDWLAQDFNAVQKSLERQKERKARIPMPPAGSLDKLAPDIRQRSSRIVWSHVSLGYQPQLTQAWFDCMNAFQQEAQLDKVFANTCFWVITRSNECFY